VFAAFDSPADIMIVVVVVLLLFGGGQLPKLAKNLGRAQKEFKEGLAQSHASSESKPETD
jgi:sec-independent protein translocase protein TatA